MAATESPSIAPLDLTSLRSVTRSRAGTILSVVLGLTLVALPIVLAVVPWQQTVPGVGRVVALDPRQRIQTIPAPVTGRLVRLEVQEGSQVRKGDLLAEMEDQDPGYFLRLQQQLEFARDKVEQAHESLEFYQGKVNSLQREKDSATAKARAELRAAIEKVKQAREDVRAKEAEIEIQKRPEFERQRELLALGTTSEKAFQYAEAALRSAEAQLSAARAKIDEALSEEDSKLEAINAIEAKFEGEINAAEADVRSAAQKLQEARTELTRKESDVSRQETQIVLAPMDGTVLLVHGANSQDLISRGAPLIDFVPDADEIAVEFLVRGVDAPLISPGRHARLQFEGWPAVQFAGWPSVAVGTFGGVVRLVDAQARADGKVRVIIVPDPVDQEWPEPPFLRQGVRASGWVQLDMVSAGYEIWRQLNAFPPTVAMQPEAAANGGGKTKDSGDKGSGGKEKP